MVSKNQDLTLFKEDPGNVGFEIDSICGGHTWQNSVWGLEIKGT